MESDGAEEQNAQQLRWVIVGAVDLRADRREGGVAEVAGTGTPGDACSLRGAAQTGPGGVIPEE